MSTLPSYLDQLEFDPKGTNSKNLVKMESHVISSEEDSHQIIVPQFGPFYSATLYDVNGVEIPKNEYCLGERLPELKGAYVEKDLYVSVLLLVPRIGEVFVSYQSVGAELVKLSHLFLSYLVSKMNEPVTTEFGRVTNTPHRQPAYEHRHHWIDFVNKTDLAASVDTLHNAMDNNHATDKTPAIAALELRVDQATQRLGELDIPGHMGDLGQVQNRHNTTAADIGAERPTDPAKNADMIYTMTFFDFLKELYSVGVNRETIQDYIRKWNYHNFEDSVNVKSLQWGNHPVTDKIRATNLFRVGTTRGLVTIGPPGAELTLNLGEVLFNGEELYDREKAIRYSDEIEGKLIVAVESDDFVVSGDTTEENPLALTIKYTLASESTFGFARLKDSVGEESDGWVLKSSAAKSIEDTMGSYLLKTVTVNGHVIDKDVVISNTELGLGDVENTSDLEKPLSAAERAILATIVQDNHNHNWNEINFVDSSLTTYGIDYLAQTRTDDGAVSSHLAEEYLEEVIELGEEIGTKALVSHFYFTGVRDVVLTSDGRRVDVDGGYLLTSTDGVVEETELMGGNVVFPLQDTGKDISYLMYFIDDNDSRRYELRTTPYPIKEQSVLITVLRNEEVFSSKQMDPVADFGSDTTLRGHKEEITPHGLDKPIPDLSVVENADVFIQNDNFSGYVWDGNKYAFMPVGDFSYMNGSGLTIVSAGANPMGWKSYSGKGQVWQSSFVVKSENHSAALDITKAPHSVVLGLANSDRFRMLSCTVEAGEKPRFYVERWDVRIVDNVTEIYLGAYTQLNVNFTEFTNVPTDLEEGNHYRFFFDEATNEIRFEFTGKQHMFYKGTLVGTTNEVRAELVELLNNPTVGIRGSAKVDVAVGPSIRKPYDDNYITNDYRSLFRTYVSASVLDRVREKNVARQTDLTLTGSYNLTTDKIDLGNISTKLPTGFTNLEIDILNVKRDSGDFDREVDHDVLKGDLYYGAELGLNKWDKGYGLGVRRNDNISLPLTAQKTYMGTVVSSLINDGDTFSIRVRVKAYNVLWGITSEDWQYLCHVLA